jgi:c(7)-type cytochrome triheme protein
MRVRIGVVALVTIAAIALAGIAPGLAQMKSPADFTFDKGKDSPGTVTFSHEHHMKLAEKCTACHTKVFKMKKGQTGPLTMEKMKAGEQCGACHNGKTQLGGKTAFNVDDKAKCETCHKK